MGWFSKVKSVVRKFVANAPLLVKAVAEAVLAVGKIVDEVARWIGDRRPFDPETATVDETKRTQEDLASVSLRFHGEFGPSFDRLVARASRELDTVRSEFAEAGIGFEPRPLKTDWDRQVATIRRSSAEEVSRFFTTGNPRVMRALRLPAGAEKDREIRALGREALVRGRETAIGLLEVALDEQVRMLKGAGKVGVKRRTKDLDALRVAARKRASGYESTEAKLADSLTRMDALDAAETALETLNTALGLRPTRGKVYSTGGDSACR